MTVESATNKAGPFEVAASFGTFPRNFRAQDETHVRVIRVRGGEETDLTSGVGHTGIGDATGSVVISNGIQSGDQIYLLRSVPLIQQSDYNNQGRVRPDQVENDFDLQMMAMQDLAERQSRALTLDVSSDVSGSEAMAAAVAAPGYAALAQQAAAEVRAFRFGNAFDIRAFGARAQAGFDNGPAISAAILAASNEAAGAVIIPAGEYETRTAIDVTLGQCRGLAILGQGSKASIIKGPAGTFHGLMKITRSRKDQFLQVQGFSLLCDNPAAEVNERPHGLHFTSTIGLNPDASPMTDYGYGKRRNFIARDLFVGGYDRDFPFRGRLRNGIICEFGRFSADRELHGRHGLTMGGSGRLPDDLHQRHRDLLQGLLLRHVHRAAGVGPLAARHPVRGQHVPDRERACRFRRRHRLRRRGRRLARDRHQHQPPGASRGRTVDVV
ncbi:hypothetical protein [Paracoccus beibuensis]|uniref:hypothetical protein n=1 Tax=Paracoccus beibuensis TaxID=547602 RepID=UPI00224061EB|nr:hypothetical protein [Paracoccus beibuensis]